MSTCQICGDKLNAPYNTDDWSMHEMWNFVLIANNLPLILKPGMFICMTSKGHIIYKTNPGFPTIDIFLYKVRSILLKCIHFIIILNLIQFQQCNSFKNYMENHRITCSIYVKDQQMWHLPLLFLKLKKKKIVFVQQKGPQTQPIRNRKNYKKLCIVAIWRDVSINKSIRAAAALNVLIFIPSIGCITFMLIFDILLLVFIFLLFGTNIKL